MHFFILLLCLQQFCWGLKAVDSSSTTFEYDIMDANHTILNAETITMPGCPKKCGNLTVPYPFGIKSEGLSCSKDSLFDITCNNSTNPPKAFINTGNLEVLDISNSELRISNLLSYKCYDTFGKRTERQSVYFGLGKNPYLFSKANVLTVVGCDDFARIYNSPEGYLPKGCTTTCQNISEVTENECSGGGCCQVSINIKRYYKLFLSSYYNHANVSSFSRCGYAFFGERSRFTFKGLSDLKNPDFFNTTTASVPIVLDWAIGKNSCTEAYQDSNSYACKDPNSYCINGTQSVGYRCNCKDGYEGNPYFSAGCKDINECERQTDDCQHDCNNTQGGYDCSCRSGYYSTDSDSKICIAKTSKSQPIKYILGMGFGCLSIIIAMNWLYCIMRRKKNTQLREKFFHQNGGLLLRQQSATEGGAIESTKHFTYEELKKATNNYSSDRILGQGGYGIVYKGILPDQRVVAIKKSRVMDQNQVGQFINEVRILTQVIHRNVVKLLGCCLECEVPLLVYEFVPNGTLFHHVHNIDGVGSWLSLENRLRIAAESSGALAYLHSAVSIPIIHRDVKLANILLDNNNVAKISDFGASRLIPMDQTEVTTLVQGTLGYLDPEYFHTGQLTEKSDVYSFGVVLAELLTGRQPICMANPQEERNLATYFVTSLKENRLLQIIEPRLVKEGTFDQLQKAAQLVKRCLNLNGDERPTMKEVTMEIESLRKYTKHPWANEHGNEDTTSLIGHTKIQHSDLYEIQLSSYHNVVQDSEQYSSGTISLLHPPTSPR
ncbi:putative wall-associated receptor kinase-like protein 16 [Heracleum sosnowskyi]|uniref:Wall-associated receptor kinase-like protein 16 n=1 Tax=Heracleum sosnowskyi TaxID=360622 RepID=A0AAD8M041_9APIA|nr:putative wall-associated receptor kinase-like protein 16 [Heracleum sosnowskyi]